MFKHYLTTAIRNLMRHRLYSAINIAGLTIGLTACMLISLYVRDELSYDQFFADAERIYKLESEVTAPGGRRSSMSNTMPPLAPALREYFPESTVETIARLSLSQKVIKVGNAVFDEDVALVDPAFLDIFTLDYAESGPGNPLADIRSVVISASTAKRYFGTGSATGKTLDLDDGNTYQVSAVFRDLPDNSHLDLNLLFPLPPSELDRIDNEEAWWWFNIRTYVKLGPQVNPAVFQAALPDFVNRFAASLDPEIPAADRLQFRVLALTDVHFDSSSREAGDRTAVWGFAGLALIILAIACFNFMNMSLSRTVLRAREAAVRKVFGASRGQIILQFMGETAVSALVAFGLAVACTELALPWFNSFAAKFMALDMAGSPLLGLGFVGLVLLTSLVSGSYPALILARFRPSEVLGSGRGTAPKFSKLRTVLVTIQFTVAIALMIVASITYAQINYTRSLDPGFDKENALIIKGLDHAAVSGTIRVLREALLEDPDIRFASFSDAAPGGTYGWIAGVEKVNGTVRDDLTLKGLVIDDQFLDTLGIRIRAGRNLSLSRSIDISRDLTGDYRDASVLINETAVERLGFDNAEAAIGQTFFDGDHTQTIAGVIDDYMVRSARAEIPAMYYIIDRPGYRMLTLRIETRDLARVMTHVNATWERLFPNRPMRFEFLDERLAKLYSADQNKGDMLAIFAGLAILVSCIGLYGLTSLAVEQRRREVSLRKVLGASMFEIMRLLLWQFSKPVIIANMIAWPVAWYFMNDWLTGFAYRIDINPALFAGVGVLALAVAWMTVANHAIRVARANPIHALRYE